MRTARLAVFAGVFAVAGLGAAAVFGEPAQQSPQSSPPMDSQIVAHGRYVVAAGDCQGCHTRPGGAPFAGGRPVGTPFGTVLSANITPDKTGIGDWTADQFYRALHEGIDDDGHHLYPAFPYNYYTKMTRADSDAAFAYLKTVRPVSARWRRNQLHFPFSIRWLMTFWNWLFLDQGPFKRNPAKSAEWNRGAYLVEGPGHCGACHTPTNFLGGPKTGQAFQGGRFGLWFAPDLTPNARTGLGGWTRAQVVEFLKTGRNAHAQAAAEMGEVVQYSTSRLTDGDLNAIAAYLSDQSASPSPTLLRPKPAVMRQGQAVWEDACSACHRMNGEGAPRFFPPLRGDANVQQSDPTTIVHMILAGVRTTPTDAYPSPLAMPSFAWKLNDEQIAAVATYIRNSWGNIAAPVSSDDVADLRKQLSYGAGPAQRVHRTPMTHPGSATLSRPETDSRDNGTPRAGRPASAESGIGGSQLGGSQSGGATQGGAGAGHPAGVATPGVG